MKRKSWYCAWYRHLTGKKKKTNYTFFIYRRGFIVPNFCQSQNIFQKMSEFTQNHLYWFTRGPPLWFTYNYLLCQFPGQEKGKKPGRIQITPIIMIVFRNLKNRTCLPQLFLWKCSKSRWTTSVDFVTVVILADLVHDCFQGIKETETI